MTKIISIANQKGGVGKTTTTVNLGIGLAMVGRKVLLIDADSQGNLSVCLGIKNPDVLSETFAKVLANAIEEQKYSIKDYICQHSEGVDFIPCNIELSGIEVSLVNVMSREYILKQVLSDLDAEYDYILIDCSPSLGMVTINALAAADSVIIPVQAEYLPIKGLEQLIRTIYRVKSKINPKLKITGILMTMINNRTVMNREIISQLENGYGQNLEIFRSKIPKSIRVTESEVMGQSIYAYDPNGKVAEAYKDFVKEVLGNE